MNNYPASDGEWVVTGKVRKWFCHICIRRKNESKETTGRA